MRNFIDYGQFKPLTFYWHVWESEWHICLLHLEWGEFDRSFISVGKRCGLWFIDLLWMRVTPR